jgi:DNA-binding SARP family transcriptional activator
VQSKKYLRQALWQIQAALSPDPDTEVQEANVLHQGDHDNSSDRLLQVDSEWVSVNAQAGMWLDVAIFERAHALAQGIPGQELSGETLQTVQEAVSLYTGDLLEGCYHDWCLFERERLQNAYLGMLNKLMLYSAEQHDYEASLDYGERILGYNRAHERTHHEMMRLRYLSGDRTAALQQYSRCVTILRDELGAAPARRTVELYGQILADDLREPGPGVLHHVGPTATADPVTVETPISTLLDHLQRLCTNLDEVQQQIRTELNAIRAALKQRS